MTVLVTPNQAVNLDLVPLTLARIGLPGFPFRPPISNFFIGSTSTESLQTRDPLNVK
jgi:hypothetical protein